VQGRTINSGDVNKGPNLRRKLYDSIQAEVNALQSQVVMQFSGTLKAFTNFSPRVGARPQAWDVDVKLTKR
jgi:hypothetical protein